MTTQHLLRAPKTTFLASRRRPTSSGRFGILRIAAGHPNLCHLIRSSDFSRIAKQTLQGFQGSRDESRRLFKRPFLNGGGP